MKLKTLRQIVLIVILMILSWGSGFWWRGYQFKRQLVQDGEVRGRLINTEVLGDEDIDFSLFWEVWRRLEDKFIDQQKIDYQQMVYGAIKGMVSSLDDPYTVFLPPQEKKRFDEDLNGSFEGVGIELGFKDGRLAVISPLKGMPAETAGIRAGDLILRLKDETKGLDEDTQDITLPGAVEKIRGEQGTQIVFTILHEDENEPIEIAVTRGTITVASVKVVFGDFEGGNWQEKEGGKVALLQLIRFGENTSNDWYNSVALIEQQALKVDLAGVILDLRNNPGGYLSEAVNLGSEFLKEGVIVKQKDASGQEKSFSVNRRGRLLETPLLVLVNKGSASASEILAGALRVHERAKLLGEQTFGKGSIQIAESLKEGAAIHITNALWLLPDGSSVDKEGLKPDYQVEDNRETEEDEQLEKAVEILGLQDYKEQS